MSPVLTCPRCGASRGRSRTEPCARCGHRFILGRGSTRQGRRIRAAVIERDGFRCQECGAELTGGRDTHADHAISKRDGGSDRPPNLRTLCAPCNLAKGAASTGGRVDL